MLNFFYDKYEPALESIPPPGVVAVFLLLVIPFRVPILVLRRQHKVAQMRKAVRAQPPPTSATPILQNAAL